MDNPFFAIEDLPVDWLRPGTERRSIRMGELLLFFISFDRLTVSTPHDHEWTSIVYVERGHCEFTVGDQQRPLGPGQGTIVPPGVRHVVTVDAGSRFVEVWYPFKGEL